MEKDTPRRLYEPRGSYKVPERKREIRRGVQRRNAMKKRMGFTKDSTVAEKVAGIRSEFISRLIQDAIIYNTQDFDPHSDNEVKKMRNLLALIRDEVQIIRALVDVYSVEASSETNGQFVDLSTIENVELLDKARQQLKKAGVSAGI